MVLFRTVLVVVGLRDGPGVFVGPDQKGGLGCYFWFIIIKDPVGYFGNKSQGPNM